MSEINFVDEIDLNEETINEGLVDNIKTDIKNTKELWDQWSKVANNFVKHNWIYRHINEKQREMLNKYYAMLTDEDTTYGQYKRAFAFICQFMGLPKDKVIIENLVFDKSKKDKEQEIVSVKYSKGLAKVKIPEGVSLIHVSPAEDIKELIPSFRSKVKGKYMYPTKRCFFTVAKDIAPTQAGLEGKKTHRYCTKSNYTTAYIDPTYADFASGSVYIETESPIPVEHYDKKLLSIFGERKKKEVIDNDKDKPKEEIKK